MHSKTIEIWVGLFVALGLLSLFFLSMKVSNLSEFETGAEGYKINARFQNIGSLRPRAAVSMGGVKIGRVTKVAFDKGSYEAVVEMRIDGQYDTLPSDTSASILTAGLLGEQYVGLTPGGTDDYLREGGEIELTQSALILEEMISRFLFNKAEGEGKSEGKPADAKGK